MVGIVDHCSKLCVVAIILFFFVVCVVSCGGGSGVGERRDINFSHLWGENLMFE